MLKGFGKSLANLFHPEKPVVETVDEGREFSVFLYKAGFIPDSEWSEMLAHDPELHALYHGPKAIH